ncbi:MAG: long-chain-fatty-acid--CoA ligase, partial [Flavobacteriaceae bacterium]|nr:long-chain-fatty-acid--CoA ligase [Flavobacteriaceae bacterium]
DQTLNIVKEALAGVKESPEIIQSILIENQEFKSFSNPLVKNLNSLLKDTSSEFEYIHTNAEETAVVIYTSGTTGKPKGAKLTHSNLAWNSSITVDLFDFKGDDIALTVLPLFHIFGQNCIMNAAVFAGISNVLLKRFDSNEVIQCIQKHSVTIFAGVPTMFWNLLNDLNTFKKGEISLLKNHWRIALSGGAAIPVELINKFEKTYGVPIFEGYGMSEGSPLVTYNQPAYKRKIGSVGLPIWGVQVKVINDKFIEVPSYVVGQIIFKGHNVMKGYFNNEEETKKVIKNGWMHSGDLGYKDDQGYLFVVDRMNDMIIRGGVNIYPREIEEVIIKHPKISLVAVVGIPDQRMGEEIMAYVILNKDQEMSKAELKSWVKAKVAANKYPRKIEFVKELPMNATGKILKRKLN